LPLVLDAVLGAALRGYAGSGATGRRMHDAASRFVLRTDVKCYYASIDHLLLMGPTCFLRRKVTSVKIPIYQYVGFDFLVLDEMW
jgi:hypothetical protein